MLWVGMALVTKFIVKTSHKEDRFRMAAFVKVCMSWGTRITETPFELGANTTNDSTLKLVWPYETKKEKYK